MLRFTDIIQGRHSAFEPKFSHFVITLIVFVAAFYVVKEYRYLLPWYGALPLLLCSVVSSIGLVISFGSLRHPKMIVVQALVFAYVATQFHADLATKAAYGVGTFLVVYFIIRKLCARYLKLRNIWETTTGIIALFVIYPYTMAVLMRAWY
jgi:hypothetical protein